MEYTFPVHDVGAAGWKFAVFEGSFGALASLHWTQLMTPSSGCTVFRLLWSGLGISSGCSMRWSQNGLGWRRT